MGDESNGNRSIYDVMIQFFDDDEWKYHKLEDQTILRLGFSGDNGSWRCYAQAKEEDDRFVFYSMLDAKVPEDKRPAMAEFLTRANYGLVIGNFEMDYSDGEVRYKTSIDVEDDRLSTALVKNLVYANVFLMDRYFPGIMKVMYADIPPAEAIEAIEG